MDIFGLIAPQDDAWQHSLSDLPYDFFHTSTFACAWQSELGLPVRLVVYRRGDSSVILPIMFRAIEADCSRTLKDAVSPYGFPGPSWSWRLVWTRSASSRSFSKRSEPACAKLAAFPCSCACNRSRHSMRCSRMPEQSWSCKVQSFLSISRGLLRRCAPLSAATIDATSRNSRAADSNRSSRKGVGGFFLRDLFADHAAEEC